MIIAIIQTAMEVSTTSHRMLPSKNGPENGSQQWSKYSIFLLHLTKGERTAYNTKFWVAPLLLKTKTRSQEDHARLLWADLPITTGGSVGCRYWLHRLVRQHSIVLRSCAFGESFKKSKGKIKGLDILNLSMDSLILVNIIYNSLREKNLQTLH